MALWLPDTSIVLHYVRDDALCHRMESRYGLLTGIDTVLISVVIEAELRALANERTWGLGRRRRMNSILTAITVVPIPFANLIDSYVEISEFSRLAGRPMGKNDLWIAATARTTGATLLTTDRDFDHLDPSLLTVRWIDPHL